MSKIHLDVLTEAERNIFHKLTFFKKYGYLAGGTALALQIRHRRSYDFDVFVKKPIVNSLRKKIGEIFGKVDFYVDTSEQISLKTKNNIAVTFVYYCYSPQYSFVRGGTIDAISIVSILDIAADKAHAIGRRAVWRDYVDLFILLRKKIITLGDLSKIAEKKFGGAFNEALFLEQLCYFRDLTIAPIEFLKKSYTPKEIQSFLEKEIETYIARAIR